MISILFGHLKVASFFLQPLREVKWSEKCQQNFPKRTAIYMFPFLFFLVFLVSLGNVGWRNALAHLLAVGVGCLCESKFAIPLFPWSAKIWRKIIFRCSQYVTYWWGRNFSLGQWKFLKCCYEGSSLPFHLDPFILSDVQLIHGRINRFFLTLPVFDLRRMLRTNFSGIYFEFWILVNILQRLICYVYCHFDRISNRPTGILSRRIFLNIPYWTNTDLPCFMLYPNPHHKSLRILLSHKTNIISLTVFDAVDYVWSNFLLTWFD